MVRDEFKIDEAKDRAFSRILQILETGAEVQITLSMLPKLYRSGSNQEPAVVELTRQSPIHKLNFWKEFPPSNSLL